MQILAAGQQHTVRHVCAGPERCRLSCPTACADATHVVPSWQSIYLPKFYDCACTHAAAAASTVCTCPATSGSSAAMAACSSGPCSIAAAASLSASSRLRRTPRRGSASRSFVAAQGQVGGGAWAAGKACCGFKHSAARHAPMRGSAACALRVRMHSRTAARRAASPAASSLATSPDSAAASWPPPSASHDHPAAPPDHSPDAYSISPRSLAGSSAPLASSSAHTAVIGGSSTGSCCSRPYIITWHTGRGEGQLVISRQSNACPDHSRVPHVCDVTDEKVLCCPQHGVVPPPHGGCWEPQQEDMQADRV